MSSTPFSARITLPTIEATDVPTDYVLPITSTDTCVRICPSTANTDIVWIRFTNNITNPITPPTTQPEACFPLIQGVVEVFAVSNMATHFSVVSGSGTQSLYMSIGNGE